MNPLNVEDFLSVIATTLIAAGVAGWLYFRWRALRDRRRLRELEEERAQPVPAQAVRPEPLHAEPGCFQTGESARGPSVSYGTQGQLHPWHGEEANAVGIYKSVVAMFVRLQGDHGARPDSRLALRLAPKEAAALYQVTPYNCNDVRDLLGMAFPKLEIHIEPKQGTIVTLELWK